MGLRIGVTWGCVGAQRGAAHGRGMGPRMRAAWDQAGEKRGAAQERCVRLRCLGQRWGVACDYTR